MSRYTTEIRKIVNEMKAPYPGFVFDIVEYPSYLAIRFYKENIEEFSEPQKISIAEWLFQLRDAIRTVEPKTHFDGAEGAPPARKR